MLPGVIRKPGAVLTVFGVNASLNLWVCVWTFEFWSIWRAMMAAADWLDRRIDARIKVFFSAADAAGMGSLPAPSGAPGMTRSPPALG